MDATAQWPDTAVPTLTLDEAYRVLEHNGTSESADLEAMQDEIVRDIEKRRGTLEKVLLKRSRQAILDGGTAATLYESMQEYMTPSGIRMTVATDMGVNRYPGSPQKPNEDRIVFDTGIDFVSVIDGIGGYADGDKTAQILAECMQIARGDIPAALNLTRKRLILENIDTNAGACFISAQIIWDPNGKPFLEARQAGDVRLVILNADATLALESQDEDMVNILIAQGILTKDEGHHSMHRNVVEHSITRNSGRATTTCTKLPLSSGMRIILMSDGITDNILTEELLPRIAGKNATEIVQIISDITQNRMENKDAIIRKTQDRFAPPHRYADGFTTKPKADNRAIAILELP